MAHQHRFNKHRKRSSRSSRPAAVERRAIPERKPPTIYGKPFIVLEDGQKNAFKYGNGAWLPYELSIAECRQEGVVNELPQQIGNMTRYEVRLPISHDT
jgi:hypothetical protein